jgi:lathosterol oxidase
MATKQGYQHLEASKSFSSPYEAILEGTPGKHLVKNFNCFINSFLFSLDFASMILDVCGVSMGHYVLCYMRNFLAGVILYYGTAGVFHYFCYIHPMSQEIFKDRIRPSGEIIWDQIKLAQASLFVYVALPVMSDYLIEEGFTKTYYTIDEIGGWYTYAFYLAAYMSLVEIGIYWMHRTLHTNKFLYKHVHLLHHKYKTPETLTPWASIAFNPIDGILQASPYVLCLFLVPCHYFTHVGLLFFTAIWATYIHDAMDWNLDPIMGSKYHTVHHTHYMYNFGQIFTFCDAFWGTLRVPTEKTGLVKKGV